MYRLPLFSEVLFFLFIDKWYKHNTYQDEPSYIHSFIIGMFQCIALIPGISRSAATIIGGLTQKLHRKAAAEFSFFLAVPTMFAASIYKLYNNYQLIQNQQIKFFIGWQFDFIHCCIAGH